jgi:alpha-tubulin suppressor-like RCC1 family protein
MPTRAYQSLTHVVTLACLGALLGCGEESAPPSAPGSSANTAVAAFSAAPAFQSVSAGWDHSCGITTGTRAYCWGNNSAGQLGTFDRVKRLTPTPVKGDRPFDAVDAGNLNTCGLTTADLAYCWGQNLPTGTTTQPVLVDQTRHFVQVSAGRDHMCGITSGGKAWCRGENSAGQLGDGTTTDRSSLVGVTGGHTFRQISMSIYHTCAVTVDDQAFCWGDNTFGQLGNGKSGGGGTSVALEVRPTAVLGGLRFRTISAGDTFTCGLTTDDRGYCWGWNNAGQLGDETLTDRLTPALVHGGKRWQQIEAGNSHACGINLEGKGFCWGRDAEGQLGIGAFDGIDHGQKPQVVAGGLVWRRLSSGGLHTCGVTTTNVAYCWGYNQKGQLGDGTATSRPRPTKVVGTG